MERITGLRIFAENNPTCIMKRVITTVLAALIATSTYSAVVTVPASDSRITYVGRTLVEGDDVSFDWSSTYAKISFQGDYLAVKASDTGKDYFNVWIDRDMSAEADKVLCLNSKDSLLVIISSADFKKGKKQANHTVIIQKRTEADQGKTTFHSFTANKELLQAAPIKERLIEFVGDSYTCGYGIENSISRNRYTPETQNTSKTYCALLARYFDADFITVSHSGQGISRNYDDRDKNARWYMPDRYGCTFDNARQPKWEPGNMKPDITMIYLGQNDFSTERQPMRDPFKRNYKRLIKEIKDYYGEDHPILCVSTKVDKLLFDFVRECVEECGYKNVYYDGMFQAVHLDNDQELGADWHPNEKAHIKLAYALIPYFSTITGWEMSPDKPVK